MATPDLPARVPLSRGALGGLATQWPRPSVALTVTLLESTQVLSLRHWPGEGSAALAGVLRTQGLAPLPEPGRSSGTEPLLIWRSPSETLLLSPNAPQAAALLGALRPVPGALACALDLSSGSLVLRLQGSGVQALLSRLVDAQALPRDAGDASRMRLADIAAVAWREAPDRAGLLVDRANDHYLARWLNYVADAA
jgi:heterotetrameric sarcosine oxidase gamma subunit